VERRREDGKLKQKGKKKKVVIREWDECKYWFAALRTLVTVVVRYTCKVVNIHTHTQTHANTHPCCTAANKKNKVKGEEV